MRHTRFDSVALVRYDASLFHLLPNEADRVIIDPVYRTLPIHHRCHGVHLSLKNTYFLYRYPEHFVLPTRSTFQQFLRLIHVSLSSQTVKKTCRHHKISRSSFHTLVVFPSRWPIVLTVLPAQDSVGKMYRTKYDSEILRVHHTYNLALPISEFFPLVPDPQGRDFPSKEILLRSRMSSSVFQLVQLCPQFLPDPPSRKWLLAFLPLQMIGEPSHVATTLRAFPYCSRNARTLSPTRRSVTRHLSSL